MGDTTGSKREEPSIESSERDDVDTATSAKDERRATKTRAESRVAATPPRSRFSWVSTLTLVASLAALGVSLSVWLGPPTHKPPPPPPPGPTHEQISAATAKACSAWNAVHAAVTMRTSADAGPDPAALQAEVVTANARQAVSIGSVYLLSHLDPATSLPLGPKIQRFADLSQEIAINALAGATTGDEAQAARLDEFSKLDKELTDLCKS